MTRICILAAVLGCLTIAACAQANVDPLAKATGKNALVIDAVAIVPVRVVADWLKATVTFDAASGAVSVTIPEQKLDAELEGNGALTPRVVPPCTFSLTVGSSEITVDGRKSTLPSPVVTAAGASYVPARGLLDALNAGKPKWLYLGWDNAAPGVILLQQHGFLHEKITIPAVGVNTKPAKKA